MTLQHAHGRPNSDRDQNGAWALQWKPLKFIGETYQNQHTCFLVNKYQLENLRKKYVVKNAWESGHKNANYVADNKSRNKNVKIQLVLNILLAAPDPLVRRTIGIVAQNVWCKLENFRSRITLAESSSRWGKRKGHWGPKRFAGDVWQKMVSAATSGASKSTICLDAKYAGSLPRWRNNNAFWKINAQQGIK